MDTDSPLLRASKILGQLQGHWQKIVIGKPEALRSVMINLLCRGHLLLEDPPGLGKTTLAKLVAKSIALTFKRIQCTPDLLPADITGVNIYDPKNQAFNFLPGPIFSDILLVDEINRTSPRTQSALLEAMAERTVTIDRETHTLSKNFMVIATQNPTDFSGTYPLPEAQLDRFFMRLSLGYSSPENEARIMMLNQKKDPTAGIAPVLKKDQLVKLQELIHTVNIDQKIIDYIVSLVQATRNHNKVRLGASPRAAIALMKASQALALLEGSHFVTPLMIQELLPSILEHRILLRNASESTEAVLKNIIKQTNVPDMPIEADDSDVDEIVTDLEVGNFKPISK